MCVCVLWIESPAHGPACSLSGPVVGEQKVLVFAGEAEFEVPERTAGSVERPDAHHEQDDVGGNQAGNVTRVLESLHEKRNRQQTQKSKFSFCSLPLFLVSESALCIFYLVLFSV